MNRSLILAAASLLASASMAATGDHVFQYQSGDLTTLERIASTHDRIEDAARDYCQDALYGTRDPGRFERCVTAVVDEVVGGIDDVRLTAYNETGTVDESLLAQR